MRQPKTEDSVELTHDHLEGCLRAGNLGVVCSIWFHPKPMYEVEFQPKDQGVPIRALLSSDQFRIIDKPASQDLA